MLNKETLWGALGTLSEKHSLNEYSIRSMSDEEKTELCFEVFANAAQALDSAANPEISSIMRRGGELSQQGILHVVIVSSKEKFFKNFGSNVNPGDEKDIVYVVPSVANAKKRIQIGDPIIVVPYDCLLLVERQPRRLVEDVFLSFAGVVHYHDSPQFKKGIDQDNIMKCLWSLYVEYENQMYKYHVAVPEEEKAYVNSLISMIGDEYNLTTSFPKLSPGTRLDFPDPAIINQN